MSVLTGAGYPVIVSTIGFPPYPRALLEMRTAREHQKKEVNRLVEEARFRQEQLEETGSQRKALEDELQLQKQEVNRLVKDTRLRQERLKEMSSQRTILEEELCSYQEENEKIKREIER